MVYIQRNRILNEQLARMLVNGEQVLDIIITENSKWGKITTFEL